MRLKAEAPRISKDHSWEQVCNEFDRYLRMAMQHAQVDMPCNA